MRSFYSTMKTDSEGNVDLFKSLGNFSEEERVFKVWIKDGKEKNEVIPLFGKRKLHRWTRINLKLGGIEMIKQLQVMNDILVELGNPEVVTAVYNGLTETAMIHLLNIEDLNKLDKVQVKYLGDDLSFPYEHYVYVEGVKLFVLRQEGF